MFGNLNYEKALGGIIGGILVPPFQFLYGAEVIEFRLMMALLIFIILDWISGSRASKKDNSYGSKYGIDGIFRTFFMLLLPAGGHFLDLIFNLPGVAFGALTIGLMVHTAESATANSIRAGWGKWLPIWLLERITNWVKSELESKISRAQQRVDQKGQGGGLDG